MCGSVQQLPATRSNTQQNERDPAIAGFERTQEQIPARSSNLQQLARVHFAFFLPFARHGWGDTIPAKSSSERDLRSPGAEIRLPSSCLFGAT
jgi:hypothetical protein